ncbi:MAG TPA: amino acid ABC transporter substrate-binding protein, partial [Xanthobacteraceae bacterium]|nr:amino acid ABC transporter substrate-binding protein [Xanthobacteraceae bacterium]
MQWKLLAPAVAALAVVTIPAAAQELTGTLKKIKDSGAITLGHRESSVPFSYYDDRQQVVGYAMDLCNGIVDAVKKDLKVDKLEVKLNPVTSATRIPLMANGTIDLECGSTTNNAERQKRVAFSPVIFVSGTKLLVKRPVKIRSYRDLKDKTVVVTAGTTNQAAMKTLSDKQKLAIRFVVAPDHPHSFALVDKGKADAFATDDVLLYGFIATAKNASDMKVVGEYLSYDPYGLVYRRDDPAFAAVVERTFARIASERRLAELYNKWFLRKLPTGETLNLPPSPQLEEVF